MPIIKQKALIQLGTLMGAAVLAANTVHAAPTLQGGSIKFKYSNWEQALGSLVDANGDLSIPASGSGLADGTQDLRGIFQVTDLFQPATSTTASWSDGDAGEHLWGVFYGFDLDAVSGPATGPFNLNYVGGSLDIYILNSNLDPFGADGVSNWTSGSTFSSINDADMNGVADVAPWLSLNFDTGIEPGSTTLDVDIDALTNPATGDGVSYLSTGTTANGTGATNSRFDTDGLTVGPGVFRDAFLQNDFRTPGTPGAVGLPTDQNNPDLFQGGWHLVSEDPVTGFVVPAPGSLLLLGTGLLGLAAAGYRRRSET